MVAETAAQARALDKARQEQQRSLDDLRHAKDTALSLRMDVERHTRSEKLLQTRLKDATSKSDTLASQLKDANRQLQAVVSEKGALGVRIRENESTLRALEAALAEAGSAVQEADELRRTLAERDARIAHLERSQAGAREGTLKLDTARRDAQAAQEAAQEAEIRVKKLRIELERSEKAREAATMDLEARLEAASRQARDAERKAAGATAELKDVRQGHEAERVAKQQAEADAAKQRAHAATLQADLMSLQRQLKGATADLARLEDLVQEHAAQKDAALADAAAAWRQARADAEGGGAGGGGAGNQIESARDASSRKAFQKTIKDKSAQIKDLESDLAKLEKSLEQAQRSALAHETNAARVTKRLDECQAQLGEAQQEAQRRQREATESMAKMEEERQARALLAEEHRVTAATIADLETSLVDARAHARGLHEEIEVGRESLAASRGRERSLLEANAELEAELEKALALAVEAEGSADEAQHRLEALEKEHAEQGKKQGVLEVEMAHARRDLAAQVAAVDHAKARLAEVEANRDALREEQHGTVAQLKKLEREMEEYHATQARLQTVLAREKALEQALAVARAAEAEAASVRRETERRATLAEAEVGRLVGLVSSSEEEARVRAAETREVSKQREAAEKEKLRLAKVLAKKEDELARRRGRGLGGGQQQDDLEAWEQEVLRLRTEAVAAEAENAELRHDLDRLFADLQRQEGVAEELESALALATEDVRSYSDKLQSADMEIESLVAQLELGGHRRSLERNPSTPLGARGTTSMVVGGPTRSSRKGGGGGGGGGPPPSPGPLRGGEHAPSYQQHRAAWRRAAQTVVQIMVLCGGCLVYQRDRLRDAQLAEDRLREARTALAGQLAALRREAVEAEGALAFFETFRASVLGDESDDVLVVVADGGDSAEIIKRVGQTEGGSAYNTPRRSLEEDEDPSSPSSSSLSTSRIQRQPPSASSTSNPAAMRRERDGMTTSLGPLPGTKLGPRVAGLVDEACAAMSSLEDAEADRREMARALGVREEQLASLRRVMDEMMEKGDLSLEMKTRLVEAVAERRGEGRRGQGGMRKTTTTTTRRKKVKKRIPRGGTLGKGGGGGWVMQWVGLPLLGAAATAWGRVLAGKGKGGVATTNQGRSARKSAMG